MTRHLGFVVVLTMSATAFGQASRPVTTPVRDRQPPKDPKRVVYFADASDNATPIIGGLRDQLKQSISVMTPEQQFNVVLLREGKLTSFNPRLVTANPDNKTKLYDFLDTVAPKGKSSLRPLADYLKTGDADLCYVLVCDGMRDVDATMARVKKEYKGQASINIIFLTNDGKSPMVKTYQKIADEHGGILKIVEADKF